MSRHSLDHNKVNRIMSAKVLSLSKHSRGDRIEIWSGRKYLPEFKRPSVFVDERTGRPITLPKFSWDK